MLGSGAEIGWDLDRAGFSTQSDRMFFQKTFGAAYLADDADTYRVFGTIGTEFGGLTARFDEGTIFYDANFPDIFSPLAGSNDVMRYDGASIRRAAIYSPGSGARGASLLFGFPLETIIESNGPWAEEFPPADVVGAALQTLRGDEMGSTWMLLAD